MNNVSKNASAPSNSANELRPEFAHKITVFMGSEENRAADIPGLSLHRRIAPTAPCSGTARQSTTEPQAAPGPWPLVPPSAAGKTCVALICVLAGLSLVFACFHLAVRQVVAQHVAESDFNGSGLPASYVVKAHAGSKLLAQWNGSSG